MRILETKKLFQSPNFFQVKEKLEELELSEKEYVITIGKELIEGQDNKFFYVVETIES